MFLKLFTDIELTVELYILLGHSGILYIVVNLWSATFFVSYFIVLYRL